jgi:hypothetical protein
MHRRERARSRSATPACVQVVHVDHLPHLVDQCLRRRLLLLLLLLLLAGTAAAAAAAAGLRLHARRHAPKAPRERTHCPVCPRLQLPQAQQQAVLQRTRHLKHQLLLLLLLLLLLPLPALLLLLLLLLPGHLILLLAVGLHTQPLHNKRLLLPLLLLVVQ